MFEICFLAEFTTCALPKEKLRKIDFKSLMSRGKRKDVSKATLMAKRILEGETTYLKEINNFNLRKCNAKINRKK